MKQLIFILLSAFLLVMPVQARHHKKKEKVTTVNNNDSTKKTLDRIYPKIFKKKDNLMLAKHSDMSIFLYNLKSASNLNGNLNCSKELEHYAS